MSEGLAEPVLLVSREAGVRWLTLNRPRVLNALNGELVAALRAGLAEAAADPDTRVVVLTGAGRAFCAGGDVKAMGDRGPIEELHYVREINQVALALAELAKPVVGAINGPAVGGGCALALGCDLLLASEQATFALSNVNRGLVPDVGATYLVRRALGHARARQLAFFGDPLDAATAERWGLVNLVVPPERLLSTAQEWAERLAAKPTQALALTKITLGAGSGLRDALELEAITQGLCFATPEFREARESYRVRRP